MVSSFLRSATKIVILIVLVAGDPELTSGQKALGDGIKELSEQISTNVVREQKKKIAVIPFRELDGRVTVLGTYLAEELITNLFKAGTFEVVERTMLDKILSELKLQESGAIDPDTAKQVGKIAGVDAIVTGTVTDLQSFVALNCRMIETHSGRVFAAAQTKIVKDDDVRKILSVPLGQDQPVSSARLQKIESGGQPSPKFETESYRIVIESLRKTGSTISLVLTLESISEETFRFAFSFGGDFYLVDENGERWNQKGDNTAGIHRLEMSPGLKIRSKFTFAATGANDGTSFSLVGTEWQPKDGRKIVINGIILS